jgi:hypothetical protein
MSEEKRFYVYAYLDPRKPGEYKYGEYSFKFLPFYIGKGTGWRKTQHLRDAFNKKIKNHKCNKIRKIKRTTGKDPIIIEVRSELIEEKAFNLEEDLVLTIGRLDLKEGPLLNLNDGGYNRARPAEESRLKNSISTKEYYKDPENKKKASEIQKEVQNRPELVKKKKEYMKDNNPMHNEEYAKKCSNSIKKFYKNNPEAIEKKRKHFSKINKHKTDKQIRACTEALKKVRCKEWIIIDPDNNIIKIKDMMKFCNENNLDFNSMRAVSVGQRLDYNNWRCYREETIEKIYPKWINLYWKTKVPKWIFTDSDGKEYRVPIMGRFCKEHNLNLSCIGDILRGRSKQHRGWMVRRI